MTSSRKCWGANARTDGGERGCSVLDGDYYDEVTGEWFCRAHAGLLAWTPEQVDDYSMQLLFISGRVA